MKAKDILEAVSKISGISLQDVNKVMTAYKELTIHLAAIESEEVCEGVSSFNLVVPFMCNIDFEVVEGKSKTSPGRDRLDSLGVRLNNSYIYSLTQAVITKKTPLVDKLQKAFVDKIEKNYDELY